MKIELKIKLDKGKELVLTEEEARSLYQTLNSLFVKDVIIPWPYSVPYIAPTLPYIVTCTGGSI